MPCTNLNFLVIEDHEFQRRCLTQLLTSLGAKTVHNAHDGQSGLRVLAECEHPIDIVICDVSMPGMDGIEFVRRWSERGDPGSLVLMSAIEPDLLAAVGNMATAYRARLIGVASKPATAAKLVPLIELHRARAAIHASDAEASLEKLSQVWPGHAFECWFEPQVNLTTGDLRSMFAVPRWRHPVNGVLGPTRFLPAVRTRGLDDDFAWMMLRQAAAQSHVLQQAGEDLLVCVPLALSSMADVNMGHRIQQITECEAADPHKLVLSIDESVLADPNIARVLENLARLRLMGFGLAIDNFGSGWMEVDKLAQAAFTELRIKSSFVAGDGDDSARAGLAVALEAAQSLKVRAVATGVASKEDWSFLHEWGCGFGEGAFIGPAMASADVLPWARRWQNRQRKTA